MHMTLYQILADADLQKITKGVLSKFDYTGNPKTAHIMNSVPAPANLGAIQGTSVPAVIAAVTLLLQVTDPSKTSFWPIVRMVFSWRSANRMFNSWM